MFFARLRSTRDEALRGRAEQGDGVRNGCAHVADGELSAVEHQHVVRPRQIQGRTAGIKRDPSPATTRRPHPRWIRPASSARHTTRSWSETSAGWFGLVRAGAGGCRWVGARLVERPVRALSKQEFAAAHRGKEAVEPGLLRQVAQRQQRTDQGGQRQLAVAGEGFGLVGVPRDLCELVRGNLLRQFLNQEPYLFTVLSWPFSSTLPHDKLIDRPINVINKITGFQRVLAEVRWIDFRPPSPPA